MNRMFDSQYEFSIQDDYFYPIHDYTPATQNREHKHQDVEKALDEYTYNYEIVATDSERRRGSDMLFLVNDEHYIWCSRTGMESAGNTLKMSQSTPKELRFHIIQTVFEAVATRKFGEIKQGISKSEFTSTELTIASPRQFVLANELTEEEIEEYYDDIADLSITLLDKYYDATNVETLKSIVEWYDDKRTEVFREYIDFTPTILSKVVNTIESKNGWRIPNEIDAGKSTTVFLHTKYDYGSDNNALIISVTGDEKIELIAEIDFEDTILSSKEYSSEDELRNHFDAFMQYTPEDVFEDGGMFTVQN